MTDWEALKEPLNEPLNEPKEPICDCDWDCDRGRPLDPMLWYMGRLGRDTGGLDMAPASAVGFRVSKLDDTLHVSYM